MKTRDLFNRKSDGIVKLMRLVTILYGFINRPNFWFGPEIFDQLHPLTGWKWVILLFNFIMHPRPPGRHIGIDS